MRFYRRTRDDKLNGGRRSLAEAQRGLVHLALERLKDLGAEFPGDPHALYVEGLVRRDYLGEGVKPRDHFEQVYDRIGPRDRESAETRAFAACNVCYLARDEDDLRKWIELSLQAVPHDQQHRQFTVRILEQLDKGRDYRDILCDYAAEDNAHGYLSAAAGKLEVALAIAPPLELTWQADLRRRRAACLRDLDRTAVASLQAALQPVIPEERLALLGALDENDKALKLDPYDAEAWNFRAAWCVLLHRYEEAISCSGKALELRPDGYVKPLINIAMAHYRLGRYSEAAVAAQQAIDRAVLPEDESQSREILAGCQRGFIPFTPLMLQDLQSTMQDEVRNTANHEIGAMGGTPDSIAHGILARLARSATPLSDVHLFAELLIDFSAETAFVALQLAERSHGGLLARFVPAAQHLAAYASGIVKQDASRFLVIVMLALPSATPSGAKTGAVFTAAPLIHQALSAYHTQLPEALAEWELPAGSRSAPGCASMVMIGSAALAGLYHVLTNC